MKKIIISVLLMGGSLHAGMTVPELLTAQQNTLSLLQEYWIDKEGNTRIGDKDATVQFSFNKNLIDRMTEAQLKNAMDAAIARFPKVQQDAFKIVVNPQLEALRDNKKSLDDERKKMEDAALQLGKILSKTQQDIMKLPDQNIAALITKITDAQQVQAAKIHLAILKELRRAFNVEMVDTPLSESEARTKKLSQETVSAKQKIAQGVANTNFKISSMVGFIGTAVQYGMCRDRHFDILTDSEGVHFTSEAK